MPFHGRLLPFSITCHDRQSPSGVLPIRTHSAFLFSEHMPLVWKTVHFRTTGNSAAKNNHQIDARDPPS